MKSVFTAIKHLFLYITLACTLQGCIFVAGAAAGAVAIAVVYDHRTIKNAIHDDDIANNIIIKIRSVPSLHENSHIITTVFNHIVLLTGETPNPAWRAEAEAIAKSNPSVDRVYNEITIQGPTSPLTRTSDSWITTKIKSKMLANDDLKSSSIKIITEDGVVYLMGIVTHTQAEIAVNIARQVSGVQKVVKVLQYET